MVGKRDMQLGNYIPTLECSGKKKKSTGHYKNGYQTAAGRDGNEGESPGESDAETCSTAQMGVSKEDLGWGDGLP